jgi:hypothetical protein
LELEDIINICLRIIITLIKENKNKIIKLLYLKKKIITVNRKILVMVLFWRLFVRGLLSGGLYPWGFCPRPLLYMYYQATSAKQTYYR